MLQNPVKKQTKRLLCGDIKTFSYRHVNGVEMYGCGRQRKGEDIAHVNCIHKYFISLSTKTCRKAFLC